MKAIPMSEPSRPMVTDKLFEGRLRIHQPLSGYRFSIDSILLAHQLEPRSGDTVLDLGTGCGVIPLILSYRHSDIAIWGVEIQPSLADLAQRNVSENHLADRITVLNADLRQLGSTEMPPNFDYIVSNPPYRRAKSGRVNPDEQRAQARHEILVTLEDVLVTARQRLRFGGRFLVVYSTDRILELLMEMRSAGIEPKLMRMVHTRPDFDAKRVLISGTRGARPGLTITPPLIIYGPDGQFSSEVETMFGP